MRMYAISYERDTLTGLRLAGIEGRIARSPQEVSTLVAAAETDSETAILLITERCAEMIPDKVNSLRLSSVNPLLVVIPDSDETKRPPDSITSLIRDAIGVKI